MFKNFYPWAHVGSVFDIDYDHLLRNGFRALIFDIDNTLVHHGDDSTQEVDALFIRLHDKGFKTVLLTNNSRSRVERFIKNIDTQYVCEANKPARDGYIKALEISGIPREETVCIGDQLFSDILGANKCGIPCILVEYIRQENESRIGIKRHLEKIILKFYRNNRKYFNRLGKIEISEASSKNAME